MDSINLNIVEPLWKRPNAGFKSSQMLNDLIMLLELIFYDFFPIYFEIGSIDCNCQQIFIFNNSHASCAHVIRAKKVIPLLRQRFAHVGDPSNVS